MDFAISNNGGTFALALAGTDISTDMGLRTAVIVSLFTDARAETDDELPAGDGDRRGSWDDPQRGSRLWLLAREKQTARTLERAREYAEEALAWLVEDGIARAVTVTAEWVRTGVLGLRVMIERAAGGRFEEMFNRTLEAA
ncbi:MAG: phage GP46 family protein [Pseudomonadota bacterium]